MRWLREISHRSAVVHGSGVVPKYVKLDYRHLRYTRNNPADRRCALEAFVPKHSQHLVDGIRRASREQPAGGLRIGEEGACRTVQAIGQLDVLAVARPVAIRRAASHTLARELEHAPVQGQLPELDARARLGATAHLEQVAQQAEAGDIGQGVDAAHTAERDARCIELCRAGEHRGVMGVVEAAFLQRGAVNADAKRLAEHEGVARPRADVALQMVRIDGPDRHQAVDRLERIERVPARNWNAGLGADRLAPLEYPADSLHW